MNSDVDIKMIRQLLQEHFRDEAKVQAWLNRPNPNLNNYAPNALIMLGRSDQVLQFVKLCLDH